MQEQAAHVLAIVLNLVQTATAKVDAVLHLLGKDQRTSIEATLDELRCGYLIARDDVEAELTLGAGELNLLVEGSALRIPGIVELPSL